MDFVYVYVKLTDKANKGSALYWCDPKDPEDWLVKDLRMSKNSSGEWETSLQNIGKQDLIWRVLLHIKRIPRVGNLGARLKSRIFISLKEEMN